MAERNEGDANIQLSSPSCELCVVLLGKTGVGKSATGNNLLGTVEFKSAQRSRSITKQCQKGTAIVNGKTITVIDTPGFFDTELSEEEVKTEILQCMLLSSPGPHVFLVVIPIRRFTQEERDVAMKIQELLSDSAPKYAMVLFTHKDKLDNNMKIEDFIADNEHLRELVQMCGNRYHSINNRNTADHQQVTELLTKIENMVALNGGQYCTNELYQKVEEEFQKAQEEILMEEDKQLQKEQEDILKEEERLQQSKKDIMEQEERYISQGGQKSGPEWKKLQSLKENSEKEMKELAEKRWRRGLKKILNLMAAVPTGLLLGALMGLFTAARLALRFIKLAGSLIVAAGPESEDVLIALGVTAGAAATLGGVIGAATGVNAALKSDGPVDTVKATFSDIMDFAKDTIREMENIASEQNHGRAKTQSGHF